MIRWSFRPRARHPLARLIAGVLGAAALLVLIAFGLFAAAALVVGGAVVLLVKALMRPSPAVVSPRAGRRRRRDRGRIQGRQRHAQPDRTLTQAVGPSSRVPAAWCARDACRRSHSRKMAPRYLQWMGLWGAKTVPILLARRSLARPLRMDTQ